MNASSPTAKTSSRSRMSASTWIASENASRTRIPDEKFFRFMSANCSRSAKAMMPSMRSRICAGLRPSRVPLSTTFSRAVKLVLESDAHLEEGRQAAGHRYEPESLP